MFKKISIILSMLGSFWQEKENGHIFRWNIFIIFIQLISIIYYYNELPRQVPIFLSLPWGEKQLGNTITILLLPTFSFVFFILNNILSLFYLKKAPLLAKLLIIFSLIFSIFAIITIYHIINLTI